MTSIASRLAALAGLAMLALPLPAAAVPLRLVRTEGWQANLPADWKETLKRSHGGPSNFGRWVYKSPNAGYVFRVNIEPDPGGAFRPLAKASFERMRDRASGVKIIRESFDQVDGRDVYTVVFTGLLLRREFLRPAIVFRLVTRSKTHRALVSVTVSAHNEKLPSFMERVDAIMDSFDLVPAKPLPGAAPTARKL